MDCRTFHRKLEDYLEGGMDFPARFSMERHAKQCLVCEKDVTQALKLRRMAQDLARVTALPNFEATLLERIRTENPRHRFWKLRSLWLYGFEGFRWRAASATALLTVCIVGGVYYFQFGKDMRQRAALQASAGGASSQRVAGDTGLPSDSPDSTAARSYLPAGAMEDASRAGLRAPDALDPNALATPVASSTDSDFIEVLVPVSDGRQLIMRLPKTIRMRYAQPTRDYFLRYVSH